MKKKWRFLGLITIFCLTIPLHGMEIKEGKIKLVLHDRIGRFSLYYLNDPAGNSYIPLFLDQDPRTSLLTVFYKGRTFRMGDSSGFVFSMEKISETGGAFFWKSSEFEVSQSFNLIKSLESVEIDGIRVIIHIKNTGETEASVGAKFLIDTYLGEDSRTHFSTPGRNRYQTETSLRPSPRENYFVSAAGENDGVGFQAALTGNGVTPVDEVIFANWKRLNETYWRYTVNSSRNFNMLPYSINDSAACLFYPEEPLGSGETREITMVFGNISSGRYEGLPPSETVDSSLTSLLQYATQTGTRKASNNEASIKADLLTVQDLIRQLNSRLDSKQPVTNEELHILQRILDELTRRKSQYE
jgi:hypothetical protein